MKKLEEADAFLKNISVLKERNPFFVSRLQEQIVDESIYKVEAAKKGGSFLKVQNAFFNSKIDPIKEAKRLSERKDFKEKDLILIAGIELGYSCLELSKAYPEKLIVVVEKDLTILKLALCQSDLSTLLQAGKLELLSPKSPEDIEEILRDLKAKNIGLILHRSSYELYKDFYEGIQSCIEKFISTQEINLATLTRFEKLWFKNTLLNMGAYLYSKGSKCFFNQFLKTPAVLVGAGPSLSKQLEKLKLIQDKVLVIAVNTSLTLLLQNEISPDFVIAVDPQSKIYNYFLPVIREKSEKYPILVAEPTISPKISKNYPGEVVFSQISFLENWILSFSDYKGELETGGSVITTAFSLARKMGCPALIFLGTDMAYTDNTLHFKGAELEKKWLFEQNRYNSLEDQHYRFLKNFHLEEHIGFYEDTVYTDVKFITYINWLEKNFSYYKDSLKIINATEGGIAFKHIQNIAFEDAINDLNIKSLEDKNTILSSIDIKNPNYSSDKEAFLKALHILKEELPDLQKIAQKGKKISRQLYEQAQKKETLDQNLLDELSDLDEKISSFSSTEILSISLQRVIHEISEELSGSLSDEEKENSELKVLKQSLMLYEGITESSLYSQTQIKKALKYLQLYEEKKLLKQ